MDFVLADNLSNLLARSSMDAGALAHRARIDRPDLDKFAATGPAGDGAGRDDH